MLQLLLGRGFKFSTNKKGLALHQSRYKILTFIMMKGSVSFDLGILIFLGDASINLTDILLGKKMTPITVQTVKQRNTANKRYSNLQGKQTK